MIRRRIPHEVYEVACDRCGAESSDAPVEQVARVALAEGFRPVETLWLCEDCLKAEVAA